MLALFCGFLGDIFLIVPERSWLFVSGLISFAVGHVCYIIALLQRIPSFQSQWVIAIAAVFYLAGLAGMMRLLWPRLPKNMFLPCIVYMGIISFMSLSALALALSYQTLGAWLAFIGSLLFVVSDGVLSFVTFRRRIPFRYVVVMSTYILAQTLLTVSFTVVGG